MTLTNLAHDALAMAKQRGIDQAEVTVNTEHGFAVSVRNAAVDTLEHQQERYFSITVYKNQRTGSASSTDLSPSALQATVDKAVTIAQYASEDSFAGLAEKQDLAFHYPDLQLSSTWDIDPQAAIDLALECEACGLAQHNLIIQCENASVSTYQHTHIRANTHGFLGEFDSTHHSISCSLLAEQDGQMERDYDYTSARNPVQLADYRFMAKHAAERAVKRLGARKIASTKCPVVFYAPMAKSLFSSLIAAINGSNLYRQTSFLCDALGKMIFPEHLHIAQHPHLIAGLGSAPFDSDGVKTVEQDYVRDGVLTNYVLNSYSARKLAMQTTGNAGGVYNLAVNHADMDLPQLLREMGTGLLVTELMGQGVRILTGDYSRGAFGYWVENGEIQYPVHEITIAGNLKTMFLGIQHIANDVDKRGSLHTGSVLINEMTVAGH